jgi:hypothetical protein
MENIEAMLCAYVEGDLDAAGNAQIEKHLQDHPQHRKLLADLMSMREMVRALPRARAPMDVGDSLRQKVERTMLLDDSVVDAPSRQRGERWPQYFGIAAVFLLASSLCFIVYKALGPTMKPAVFTENTNIRTQDLSQSEQPQVQAPTEQMQTHGAPAENSRALMAMAQPQAKVVNAQPPAANAQAPAPPPPAPAVTQSNGQAAPSLATTDFTLRERMQSPQQTQNQMLATTPVDVQAIRQRLENSGYLVQGEHANPAMIPGGVAGGAPPGAGRVEPVLMVVNTTDMPATKAQVVQFLSNSSGVAWNAVPAESQFASKASTMPGGEIASKQSAEDENAQGTAQYAQQLDGSTKQQISDMYVARGLTPEKADALRQLLTIPQNGSAVQVSMQSADGLTTTRPSDVAGKDTGGPPDALTNGTNLGANYTGALASPAVELSDANRSPAADINRRPLTAQSDLKTNALPPSGLSATDTIIVLQTAALAVNQNSPTTQPTQALQSPSPAAGAALTPAPPPAPSTQP